MLVAIRCIPLLYPRRIAAEQAETKQELLHFIYPESSFPGGNMMILFYPQ